jgi:hypothetical protein
MKKIISFGLNAVLLAMFISMVLLPTSFMGKMKYENDSTVLSAQDYSNGENSIKYVDDPNANIPEDVEKFIMKMEKEYYQTQQTQVSPTDPTDLLEPFSGDIEREEDLENINIVDTNDIELPSQTNQ